MDNDVIITVLGEYSRVLSNSLSDLYVVDSVVCDYDKPRTSYIVEFVVNGNQIDVDFELCEGCIYVYCNTTGWCSPRINCYTDDYLHMIREWVFECAAN